MRKSKIFPDIIRENSFCNIYSEIALQNYYEAKKLYQDILNNNYTICDTDINYELNKYIIIVCVFSAMSIESFLITMPQLA